MRRSCHFERFGSAKGSKNSSDDPEKAPHGVPHALRSNDTLMKRKKKRRLIVDVDSTEDPAYGKQENVSFNVHFGKN